MTKSARAAKLPPIVPSRQGSSGATEESGSRDKGVLSFPPSNQLIITTKRGVYTWDAYGITEVFRSGSEGIAAAKKIVVGNEMLAVADSQVVVLHDISGGLQRSYRLKGSDVGSFLQVVHRSTDSTQGQVRLLKYANESKNLFFTTTLQNSVQSYSLKRSRLLDPTHTHPSPPSVFALSCTSRFLLSTSPAPPTIHLTCLALSTSPVLLHPQCSSSAAVAVEFHPERENYFCIAFADGTAAVYDAFHFYDSHGNGERRENAGSLGNCGEKAFIRGLHIGTMTRNAATEDGVSFEASGVAMDQGGIGSKESGISAVAFVPGRKATVVTVGADGKCCVVDFTQPTKNRAVLLKSWHIRRPATSLSIICSTKKAIIGQFDGANDAEPEQRHESPNESYYIAVGRSDGRVLLFDLDGKALGEQALNASGAQIIDLEWTEIGSASMLPHQNIGSGLRRSPVVKRKRRSLGSSAVAEADALQMGYVKMSPKMIEHCDDPLFDFTTPHQTLGPFHWEPPSDESNVAAVNAQEGVRKGNKVIEANKDSHRSPSHATTKRPSATVQRRPIENSSQTETEESSLFLSSIKDGSIPPIPPRPKPRPGGRLSMRRAQTSRHFDTQNPSSPSMVAKVRRVSSSSSKLSKALSVATPPATTKLLFGPRKSPSPRINDSRNTTKASEVRFEPKQPDDAWLDVPPETPRGANKVSPVSSATSNKSYKTAMSQPYTSDSPERSDDTVVDWTVGLPRQPVPTLQITHPSGERSSKAKSKKKGHISLSVSSASAGTSTPTPFVSDAVIGPINRSPAGSPPKVLPSLPPFSSREPMLAPEEKPKQKDDVSLSVSSAFRSDTITPMSSGSDRGLNQWSSLKKSPRIPDLNKGLSDPRQNAPPPASSSEALISDSTTDSILREYAASPSPSPPRAPNTAWLASTIYPESEPPSQSKPETPPKPSLPFTAGLERESQAASCTCSLTFKSILEASLTPLRAEIAQQFEAQKIWFEELLRADEDDRRLLAEENRGLRDELARYEVEGEKGKSWGGISGSPEG